MELVKMFNLIEEYHKTLGYHMRDTDLPERMENVRNGGLALTMEVAELIDSFPWKPWRKPYDQPYDLSNAKVEIVDIIFFLGYIMEAMDILPEELEIVFESKLRENYDRIKRGYSNTPEERG